MGCKGSKEGGDDDKKIDSSFKHTGLPKFDQLFENASTILESCEKIRGGLEDSKEDGMSWAGTDQLKDGKYIETLRVLLWAISSQAKGKILDAGVEPKAEKPYLAVDIAAFNYETRKLYETFQDYVNTVTDSPDDLQTSITKLQELVEMIPDTVQTAKADLEASSMNFKQKADCAIAIKKNAEKLPKEVNKCKRLSEVLKEAAKDLKETVPELKTLVNGADEIGKKAEGEALYKPKEIFDKFHPGERAEEDKGKKDDKKGEKKEEKKGEKKGEKKEEKKDDKKEEKKEEKKDDKKEESPEKKAESKSPEKEEK